MTRSHRLGVLVAASIRCGLTLVPADRWLATDPDQSEGVRGFIEGLGGWEGWSSVGP